MPILGADISVIVSEEPLEPVTAKPVNQEEIEKVFVILLKKMVKKDFSVALRLRCVMIFSRHILSAWK